MHYLPPTPGFRFIDHTVIGCSLVRGTPYRYIGQTLEQRAECDGWPARWSAQVNRDQPDVALLIVGRWETVDRVNEGGGHISATRPSMRTSTPSYSERSASLDPPGFE